MDVNEWIDERLTAGASRDEIVADLVEQGWSESEARERVEAHHQVAAEASSRSTARLPYIMSAGALLISVLALAFVLTAAPSGEQSVIRYPSGDGGATRIPQNGTVDATTEIVSVEILGGELSPDPTSAYPVDSILRISNGDDQAYTVTSAGLGLDTTMAGGENIETQITEAGSYTLRVSETGSEITIRITE